MVALPAPPPATTSAAVDSSPSSSSTPSPSSSSSPSGSKLRLMCSYGGHIVPRPLDKTLCYAGGETRIAAIDCQSAYSLSAVTAHLSKSFMNGRPFCLKYQLPNHELDSLISISNDEDLANMIDEYDRLASAASPARLRFFLFPVRSPSPSNFAAEAAASAADIYDPTSEDWFIDALRNVGVVAKGRSSDSADAASAAAASGGGGALGDSGTSLPESIVLEKNSSFESTSSSASASNSPAIRGGGGGGGEEGHVGLRLHDVKVPMPSVDSIGSDSSLASPHFSPQAIVYQDASAFIETKVFPVETETNVSDRSPWSDLLTPVQVPGYILTKPMEQKHQQAHPPPPPPQPQYIHPPSQSHYVAQYYPSPVPVAPYPTMYHQPYVQYQINKPYPHPVYMMPVPHAQNPYDIPAQGVAPTGHPQVPPNPVMANSPLVYEGYKPAPVSAAEYAAPKVYKTPPVVTQPIHMPSDDPLHQVVAFPPVNQPSQPVVSAALETANFISEYEDHMHAQIYKTQPPGPTLPSQLQTATNAAPVMLSEAFTQLHVENAKL